ncbi:hypothetical protein Moror_11815 [Moniliophthora roreri MCA 2997]|uniref:Uncharacterized protein n=2 Tax=Moniliophthora roreri TaxID=221103 RepID=V2XU63_MONRO|nr:hypothetical protein Moror_11815 [Moniliophthora roreri MCA 2997]
MPRHNIALLHPGARASKKASEQNAVPPGIINPRRRISQKPPPHLTTAQRKSRREKAEERREDIRKAMKEWFDEIDAKAEALAEEFGRKKWFFLDMLYQNGVKLSKPQAKTNSWNAWLHLKALELKEAGEDTLSMEEMVQKYRHEYDDLDDEEKEELVTEFDELKADNDASSALVMPTARSRAQEIAKLISTVVDILMAGKRRCGIEAMVLFVRNHTQATLYPRWFFTHPAMSSYMRHATRNGWDQESVGAMMEAFAVVGCDPISKCYFLSAEEILTIFTELLKTAAARTNWYKAEIRDLCRDKLSKAIGQPVKSFPYDHFDKVITLPFGVVVENWPLPEFVNPSKMSSAHGPLIKLYEALDKDVVKFRKMEDDEWQEWVEQYRAEIDDGTRVEKPRNPRSDIGKTRGPYKKASSEQQDLNFEDDEGRERGRTDREDSEDNDDIQQEQPSKRTKKAVSKSKELRYSSKRGQQGQRTESNTNTPPADSNNVTYSHSPSTNHSNSNASRPKPRKIGPQQRIPVNEDPEDQGDERGMHPSGPTATLAASGLLQRQQASNSLRIRSPTHSPAPSPTRSPAQSRSQSPLFLPDNDGNNSNDGDNSGDDWDIGDTRRGADDDNADGNGQVDDDNNGVRMPEPVLGKRLRKPVVQVSLFAEDHPNTKQPRLRLPGKGSRHAAGSKKA